jgi:hypothetical protein
VTEWNGFGHGRKRTLAFLDCFSRLSCRTSQALQVANHIVEPGLGSVEKAVTPSGEEEKGEPRSDSGTGDYPRRLSSATH